MNQTELMELIHTTSGVDVLLFDIQDVGSRFYTFIWTMYDMMLASSKSSKSSKLSAPFPFIVLDRPNPLNGPLVQGPMLGKCWC